MEIIRDNYKFQGLKELKNFILSCGKSNKTKLECKIYKNCPYCSSKRTKKRKEQQSTISMPRLFKKITITWYRKEAVAVVLSLKNQNKVINLLVMALDAKGSLPVKS
jgi:DNA-directed RNA polymerase subunit RPC12/RpoP